MREREGDSSIAGRRGAFFHFQGSPNGGYKQIEQGLEGRWMSGRAVDMLVFSQLASYNFGGVEGQNEKTPDLLFSCPTHCTYVVILASSSIIYFPFP